MTTEFEKGREYEHQRRQRAFHLFLGGSCLVLSPIWFFFSVWDFQQRLYGLLFFLVIGSLSLWLGYSGKKEIKELKNENN